MAWSVLVVVAWWWDPSKPVDAPVIGRPVAPAGMMLAPWASEDAEEDGVWSGREARLAPDCDWWNGTYYYDLGLCNHMSVTRMPAVVAQKAVERATRCAAQGATDCVLSGEIGLNVPAAFVYDGERGMRMVLAPRMLPVTDVDVDVAVKTVRLQDPEGLHPNQLFEFNASVRVEYLRAASRKMATLELHNSDAYCMQALRRAVSPTCWAVLD